MSQTYQQIPKNKKNHLIKLKTKFVITSSLPKLCSKKRSFYFNRDWCADSIVMKLKLLIFVEYWSKPITEPSI